MPAKQISFPVVDCDFVIDWQFVVNDYSVVGVTSSSIVILFIRTYNLQQRQETFGQFGQFGLAL